MYLNNKEISSFLMYRMINPLSLDIVRERFPNRIPVYNSNDLNNYLKKRIQSVCKKGKKVALALSGGIDSAIIAKYMPENSIAYTFKCIVPGVNVIDESKTASIYAKQCNLDHRIIEVYWEDFEKYAELLMAHKKAPIHSIEVQIYKAALQAKQDGVDTIIFGEAADAVYGGLSGLLSKTWTIGDFINRYSFVLPYVVLKNPFLEIEPYRRWEENGYIDPYKFISNVFIQESISSYINATDFAGINIVLPYPETYLACEIDYNRIRAGENKYIVREVFQSLYPGFAIPQKTPMPRPMNEWLKEWKGPKRKEFWPNCESSLSGDQKWMVWALERYLNM